MSAPRDSQTRMGLPFSQETRPGFWDASPAARRSGNHPRNLHPSQPSPGRGAISKTFFRTLPTLPLVGSGQSPPTEGTGSTAKDELAGSQSRASVHRRREGRFKKDYFPLPGRSRVERLAHPLPGPSAPVPCPSYRSPPPPHPEIARDTRRPLASRAGEGSQRATVPFGYL